MEGDSAVNRVLLYLPVNTTSESQWASAIAQGDFDAFQ